METSPTAPSSPAGPTGPRASFGQRLGAYLIDVIIIVVVVLALYAILKVAGYVIGIALSIAYFIYFEGSDSGQTFGKRALGIRVVDYSTGGPLGYGKSFLRYIGRIASGAICYLGYFWMLWDKERQTWHDKLIKDVVVPTSAYPVSSWPN